MVIAFRRGNCFWTFLFMASVLLSCSYKALAQLPTGSISGMVRDSSGAVIAGAAVTATNRDTALARTVQSGADGHYQLRGLPVGFYDVKSEASGFQSQNQQNLNLSVGQEAVLNFTLSVGAVQETVSVTAEAPLVDTTSGSLGGLVNEQRVTELPLNGRSFNNLVLLQTGISVHHPVSTTSTTSIGLAFSSNGAPVRSNYMTLDGAGLAVASLGLTGISPSGLMLGVDAIREFRVITNNFPAEYGMTMGSQMIIVSKGGTNQFHGSVFDFLRNSTVDARNFFSQTNPPYHRNNFGGNLGGPIKKDKDFFFASYEGVRELLGVPRLLNVPNAFARRSGGLVPQVAASVVPFLNLYPLPNGVLANDPAGLSGVGTYAFSFNQTTDEDFGQIRIDHNFSTTDQFFARYTVDDTRKIAPNGTNPATFQETEDSRGQFFTLAENHVFSPAVLNIGRISYTRPFVNYAFISPASANGLGFLPGLPMGSLAPAGGVTSIGSNAPGMSYRENGISLSDDLSWIKNKHSFKFGALFNRYRSFLVAGTNFYGGWTFSGLPQFLTATPLQFTSLAPGSQVDRTYVWNTLGFYGQDEWRPAARLTLNIGLRYEFITTINEVTGRGSSVRDVLRDAAAILGGALYQNPSLRNLGPRFGFAWDVAGDGKTAVRGGFGIQFDLATNLLPAADVSALGTPPYTRTVALSSGLCFTAVPSVNSPSTGTPPALRTIEYKQAQTHLLSYNLTVERQLPDGILISAGYAGSRGLNLIQSVDGDPAVAQIQPSGAEFWPANTPRMNPAWAYCECKTTGGDSWYNSLQLSLRKRTSHNLEFQVSYTFSKLLDDTQGQHGGEAGGVAVTPTDPYHLKTDKGPSNFDDPHYFAFNTLYTLPSPAQSGLTGALAKGWRMGSIVGVSSGLPFSVFLSGNRSRSGVLGNSADRPDLVPGCHITLGGPDKYFDPACFSIQPLGFLGNAGPGLLFGPLHVNWDFSLTKDTALPMLGEGRHLEFRAEFFNLLNHADFNIPVTGRTVFTADPTRAVTSPLSTAGQIGNTIAPARQIQFALKVFF